MRPRWSADYRAPAVLLLVCVLAYGFWIPRLGLYWDDWYTVWAVETGGAARLLEGLATERPLHGWMYAAAAAIHEATPVGLHALVLAIRWISAVAAWWAARAIWPARRIEALAIALLVAVYPGFSQQSLPMTYGDYFLTLAFFLVSLGAMVWALRRPRRFWWLYALSLLSAIPAHWILEYWFGLELLRLPLAFWLLGGVPRLRERVMRTALITAPFYLNILAGVLRRVLVVDRTASDADNLSGHLAAIAADPVGAGLERVGYALSDFGNAIVFAWARTVQPGMPDARLRFVIAAVLLVGVAGAVTAFFMRERADASAADGRPAPAAGVREAGGSARWPAAAMALGLGAILVGQLPLWITDRYIQWQPSALDRHSLPAMFGSAVFLVGFARMLLQRRRAFVVGTAILVGLGVSFQFRQGHEYWREHERQASFFWQLHWRAPGLAPGTAIFLHHRPVSVPQPKDYTYAVPLNLIYDADHDGARVRYWVFPDAAGFPPYWLLLLSGGDEALTRRVWDAYLAGADREGEAELERQVRNLGFSGSTASSVVALHRPPGCLRVLDPARDEVADVPAAVREARLRSRPALIRAHGRPSVAALTRFYGPEPERGWCYHYQKAELARQLGEWERVAELADEALRRGLRPTDDREWSPFIEGYVRAGRHEEAGRLVREVVPYGGSIWDLYGRHAHHRAFCDLQRRLSADGLLDGPAADVFGAGAERALPCSPPDPAGTGTAAEGAGEPIHANGIGA